MTIEKPGRSMAEIVEAEINDQYEGEGFAESSKLTFFLNDFHKRLPVRGGLPFRLLSELKGSSLDAAQTAEFIRAQLDETVEGKVRGYFEEGEEEAMEAMVKEHQELHTSQRLVQSNRDFAMTALFAINASGIDVEALNVALERSVQLGEPITYEIRKNLLLPVYIKLRELGYNHQDLIRA